MGSKVEEPDRPALRNHRRQIDVPVTEPHQTYYSKLPMLKQITETTTADLKYIAIQGLLLVTFGLASLTKWKSDGVPGHFINQFGDTWFASLPFGLALPFYTIALLETLVFVFFILSVFRVEWVKSSDKMYLRLGLILSLFVFVILAYGLRLTGEFGGTANAFFYFGVTLFALYLCEKESNML
jgi:hypothetical protein